MTATFSPSDTLKYSYDLDSKNILALVAVGFTPNSIWQSASPMTLTYSTLEPNADYWAEDPEEVTFCVVTGLIAMCDMLLLIF